jgi:hypothetical protein
VDFRPTWIVNNHVNAHYLTLRFTFPTLHETRGLGQRQSPCPLDRITRRRSYQRYLPLKGNMPLKDNKSTCQNDPKTWGMRVLSLRPGSRESEIHCDLVNTSIGEFQGKYEALSYAWGDANDTRLIWLNGELFSVTNNLATALRNLRREKKPRNLWIDAICIDQSNIPERNLQVQRMWAIFQNSYRVVVFLGEEAEHTRPALRLVKRIVNLAAANTDRAAIANISHSKRYLKAWEGIRDLLERPWWRYEPCCLFVIAVRLPLRGSLSLPLSLGLSMFRRVICFRSLNYPLDLLCVVASLSLFTLDMCCD